MIFLSENPCFLAPYSAPYWEIRVFGPISNVEKNYFCCIFTKSARIKTTNIDLKSPFEGESGQLIQSGTWWNYGGVIFHYRSIVDFQVMALG